MDLKEFGSSVRLQYARFREEQNPSGRSDDDRLKQSPQDLLYVIGTVEFGGGPDEVFLNNGFAHLRWTRMWMPALGTELFGQLQYNEFIKLKRRLLFGLGARFAVLEEKFVELHFGTGVMLESESLDVPPDGPDDPHQLAYRWTNYVSCKFYLFSPKVQMINTVYAQPRFSRWSDLRVLDEAEVETTLADGLTLALSFSLRYDRRPPNDVERLDVVVNNRIRLRF